MKKYLLEPYIEQTGSYVLTVDGSNTTDITRAATYSYQTDSSNPINNQLPPLLGNLNLNVNYQNSQVSSIASGNISGQLPTTTYAPYNYTHVNKTNPLYPIGISNTPTIKTYPIITKPILIPQIEDNSLIYFGIGIIIIIIICIIIYFFVL